MHERLSDMGQPVSVVTTPPVLPSPYAEASLGPSVRATYTCADRKQPRDCVAEEKEQQEDLIDHSVWPVCGKWSLILCSSCYNLRICAHTTT